MMPNKKTMPTKRTNGSSQFSKGTSGNPSGRPLGSRNHATVLMESLLEGKAEELLQKAVEMALAGDTTALRLCMDRLMPARKDRPIKLSLPPIDTVQQISLAVGKVAKAIGDGEITPIDGEVFTNVLVAHKDIVAQLDFAQRFEDMQRRLADLEGRVPAKGE
jgi:Family of unknown function (DUF5681)